MYKCGLCEKKCTWNCFSCSVLLCNDNKRIHIDDDSEHNYKKFKLKINEDLKKKALESLTAKIEILDQWSNELLSSSEIIATCLTAIINDMQHQIQMKKSNCLELLQNVDQEVLEDQINEIEKEIEAEEVSLSELLMNDG